MGNQQYTTSDIKTLQRVSESGGSIADAAKEIGRTYRATASFASKMEIRFKGGGKKARKVSDSVYDAIKILAQSGMGQLEILRVIQQGHEISQSYLSDIAGGRK